MAYHARLDWSGDPAPTGSPYYVACVVGLRGDVTQVGERLAQVRHQFGMRAGEEFHAHRMSDAMRLAVIQIGVEFEMRVSALICDKTAGNRVPPPGTLPGLSGIRVVNAFIERYQMKSLSCDEEIDGRNQAPFKTAVQRLHRAHWPAVRMSVRFRESQADELIQMADVTAYCLTHLARATIKENALQRQMEAIRSDSANWIVGPCAWDDWEGDDLRS